MSNHINQGRLIEVRSSGEQVRSEDFFASSYSLIYNTGLYYLQTRYYNPSYGRFLNADTTEILEKTKGTVLGANIFAYCNNNPVMNVDYTGEVPDVTGAGIGAYLAGFIVVVFFVFLFGGVIDEDTLEEIWDRLTTEYDYEDYENM